jgi:putative endopeptidase
MLAYQVHLHHISKKYDMKIVNLILAGAAIATVGLVSCQSKDGEDSSAKKDFKFIDRANMDTTISPGDDFFLYANGAWLKNTQIPGDKTRWGSFDELRDRTNKDVRALLDAAASSNAAAGSTERNVGDFYKSGMDSVAIEAAGLNPLKPILDRINAISTSAQILDEVALAFTQGIHTVVTGYISPDDKNVTRQMVQLGQAGLGLPTKDYYTDQDSSSSANRTAYKNYIAKVLQMAGQDEATALKNADAIFALEMKFANASLRPVEMRDPQRMYNKYSLADFSRLTPGIDWKIMFEKLNVKGEDSLIVQNPKYYQQVARELQAAPVDVWKQYLTFHVINDMAPYLSSNFSNARFDFYGRTLRGQKQQEPRWERVMGVLNGAIGDQLGELYVSKHFKPEAKKRMLELVNNLQETFHERISNLDWMSDITKQKAIAKLNTFVKKIGYPDKWKNYGSLKIVADNYVQNVLNASAFEYNYQLSKLGKPVDKTEWYMTPNTVNAYYNPSFNEIVFPAAILQFPFFDFDADDAVNYGGIGAVIGHEMTHGFDDQGCQYDADGNLRNWWTPEDAEKFAFRTDIVRKQFDGYTVLGDVHVDGSLTLGENIADLGGITIAYEAFKKTKQGQSQELIDGFTPDQRFFLSWAQVWRGKATPETARQLIKLDPHSPSEWRGNGPLSNFEPFYKAFNVTEGQKMWRADSIRAKIW